MKAPTECRRILLVLAILSYSTSIFSQSTDTYVFPSPNNSFLGAASNMGATGSVGVDLYTGMAQISVPICTLPAKQLKLPISLAYVGGKGIKVQDYASSVGLGWQLNAGGNISRVIRGFPDEQANGYLGSGQWGVVVAGELTNTTTWTAAQATALTGIQSNGSMSNPTADGEPDLYYVRTPFFSFEFTFDEHGNPIFSNYNGFQIKNSVFSYSSGANGASFLVIDDQGNQYYFGSSSASIETTTSKIFGTNYTFASTWYLDKIVSYDGRDVISLTYANYFSSDVFNHYIYYVSSDGSGYSNTYNTPITTTINQPLVVKTIASPLGEVDFTYATGRSDDASGVMLSSLTLKAFNPQTSTNSTSLQTYGFNYSYFGSPSTDPNVLRLRLDAITLAGNTSSTSTPVTYESFTYNSAVTMPSRQNLSAVDYFGYNSYISGSNPNNLPQPANVTYATTDILTQLTDLYGKTTTVNYELNMYYANSTNVTVGGLRVSSISTTLVAGDNLTTQYKYVDNNNNSTGQILSNSYTGDAWYAPCPLGTVTQTLSESPSEYYDLNGNFVGYSSVKVIDPKGGYTITTFTNFLTSGCADALEYTNSGIPDISSDISAAYKRGLPLDRSVYTTSGQILSDDATPLTSYTSYTSPVLQKAWGYHWANLSFAVTGSGYTNACGFGASTAYYTKVENFFLSQSVHTDYDQNSTSRSVARTTTYTFAINATNNTAYAQTIGTTDSKGQTVTKKVYRPNDSGIPLVSTTNTEQQALAAMVSANFLNVPIHEVDTRNQTVTETHNTYLVGAGGNNALSSPNTYLATSTSYNTIGGVQTQSSQKNYNFDQITYNPLSTSSYTGYSSASPGGKPMSVSYGYNSCYPIAKVENATSYLTYSPLVTNGWLYVPGSNYNQYSASFTTYFPGTITISMPPGSYLSGSVTCFFNFTLTGAAGGGGSLCENSASGYTCSYSNTASFSNMPAGTYYLYVKALTNTASSSNNIGFEYTYNTYQATPTTEFYFEGFEQNPSATAGAAHTGNMYYNGNYTVTWLPPNSRSYLIQYWSLSGGQWVFHETSYSQNMVLTGPVDDIRVFPVDALMTSYTYNPIVGMTSQTDPSGRSVIYQYDGLNRLQTVLDQDNNVLKTYTYGLQLLAAPVGNQQESGTYQRSCPSGQVGSYVTYTVPAGKYTSYISQTDANQQAMNDVTANGQAYANNPANGGTCTPSETVNYTDSRTFQYTVRFTNNSTGLQYNFTANANTSSSFGQIPGGTYTVYICPINNYTPNNNYNVNGAEQFNVVCATFNNVSVNSTISLSFF